ncbi:MAG: DNA polymerase III subunit chi [Gammaproteobacteria bacterium]|nr:DNA polymerase III subunit chi [Gammaproteobacteria bacterium]
MDKGNDEARLLVACRLAEKAYSLGHQIFIQVEDAQQQGQLDQLLWEFKSSSFVPHATSSSMATPVEIGLSAAAAHQDVFINLSSKQCDRYNQFNRINEIVGPDEESLAAGRQNYRFYLTQGFKPETHKI